MPLGSFVLGAVAFLRPTRSIAPQMEERGIGWGGKERDDLPYAEGAAVHMHINNVHGNTRAPHARRVLLINLPSLPARSATRGSFVLI